jgi:hypothetical protein
MDIIALWVALCCFAPLPCAFSWIIVMAVIRGHMDHLKAARIQSDHLARLWRNALIMHDIDRHRLVAA